MKKTLCDASLDADEILLSKIIADPASTYKTTGVMTDANTERYRSISNPRRTNVNLCRKDYEEMQKIAALMHASRKLARKQNKKFIGFTKKPPPSTQPPAALIESSNSDVETKLSECHVNDTESNDNLTGIPDQPMMGEHMSIQEDRDTVRDISMEADYNSRVHHNKIDQLSSERIMANHHSEDNMEGTNNDFTQEELAYNRHIENLMSFHKNSENDNNTYPNRSLSSTYLKSNDHLYDQEKCKSVSSDKLFADFYNQQSLQQAPTDYDTHTPSPKRIKRSFKEPPRVLTSSLNRKRKPKSNSRNKHPQYIITGMSAASILNNGSAKTSSNSMRKQTPPSSSIGSKSIVSQNEKPSFSSCDSKSMIPTTTQMNSCNSYQSDDGGNSVFESPLGSDRLLRCKIIMSPSNEDVFLVDHQKPSASTSLDHTNNDAGTNLGKSSEFGKSLTEKQLDENLDLIFDEPKPDTQEHLSKINDADSNLVKTNKISNNDVSDVMKITVPEGKTAKPVVQKKKSKNSSDLMQTTEIDPMTKKEFRLLLKNIYQMRKQHGKELFKNFTIPIPNDIDPIKLRQLERDMTRFIKVYEDAKKIRQYTTFTVYGGQLAANRLLGVNADGFLDYFGKNTDPVFELSYKLADARIPPILHPHIATGSNQNEEPLVNGYMQKKSTSKVYGELFKLLGTQALMFFAYKTMGQNPIVSNIDTVFNQFTGNGITQMLGIGSGTKTSVARKPQHLAPKIIDYLDKTEVIKTLTKDDNEIYNPHDSTSVQTLDEDFDMEDYGDVDEPQNESVYNLKNLSSSSVSMTPGTTSSFGMSINQKKPPVDSSVSPFLAWLPTVTTSV